MTRSDTPCKLLNLPEELLLNIALHTDVIGIKGLALTCRQLRPLAQEALLRSAPAVAMGALWILVEELQKWEFSSKIPHICLGTSERGADSQQIAELVRVWMTRSGHRRCRDIIQRMAEAAELTGYEWWLTALNLAFGSKKIKASMISSLGLSLVFAMFAMTPTIGKLVLSLSAAVNYDVLRSLFGHAKFPPQQWHLPVHQIIRKRIETLELTKDISMLVSYQNKRAPWLCPHSTQHLSFALRQLAQTECAFSGPSHRASRGAPPRLPWP